MRLATVPIEEGADAGGSVSVVCEPAAPAAPEPLPGGSRLSVRGDPGRGTPGRRWSPQSGGRRATTPGRPPALGTRRPVGHDLRRVCLLYTSPSPRDRT